MFGAVLKATNSSFQKVMTCCRSIYVKKVMKLFAFIFEQPSYTCSQDRLLLHCSTLGCEPKSNVLAHLIYYLFTIFNQFSLL